MKSNISWVKDFTNSEGYFSFEKVIDFLKSDYKVDFNNGNVCLFIMGPRNNGKTTSLMTYYLENVVNENEKILFCRTKQEEKKKFVSDFNDFYYGRFQIYGSILYRTKITQSTKKDGSIEERQQIVGRSIGYCADITTAANYKGAKAQGIKWIMIDEVVSIDPTPKLYWKLINLLTTFKRDNTPSIVMIGNRDNPNNEIMNAWGVKPHFDPPKDNRVELVETTQRCFFIDLGTEQFEKLKRKRGFDVVSEMASLNEETDNYLNNGGFSQRQSMRVLKYTTEIAETFKPKFFLTYEENRFCFGSFIYENQEHVVICQHSKAIKKGMDENLATIAIDKFGLLNQESIEIDKEDIEKLFKMLIFEYKKENLYSDNFDILDYLKKVILNSVMF